MGGMERQVKKFLIYYTNRHSVKSRCPAKNGKQSERHRASIAGIKIGGGFPTAQPTPRPKAV